METNKNKTPEQAQAETNAAILQRLTEIRDAALLAAKEVLTTDECALLTGYAVPTLHGMAQRNEIPHFRHSPRRLYFKKSELEKWMTRNRVASDGEINAAADTYTALHKRRAAKRND